MPNTGCSFLSLSYRPSAKPHGLALDVQLRKLLSGVEHGRADGGVIGQQHHGIALPVEVLEGGFLAHPHGGDLALLHLGLAADAYDVSVAYRGRHTVAVAGQGKIRVPRGGHPDIALDVLLGGDGGAAGDAAHQRYPHHFGQGLKPRRDKRSVSQPHQPCGGAVCMELLQICP